MDQKTIDVDIELAHKCFVGMALATLAEIIISTDLSYKSKKKIVKALIKAGNTIIE